MMVVADVHACTGAVREGELVMRKLTLSVAAAAVAVMVVPGAALAHDGPPVDVFTSAQAGSATMPFAGPCGGSAGTVTIAFHDTFHITQFADGHAVATGSQAGSFAFAPFDPTAPDSSGRYRTGFNSTFTQNSESTTSVFTVVGRDDNGDQVRFQVRSHFTLANGEVRVDHFTLSCP